jgi:EAL domain-containing protein (putative c-di-GMP-specific phosphodiesterase class I)
VETLLSNADVALYRAKAEGRGTYRFFTEAMDTEVRTRVRGTAELREAINSDQLFLLYQPQVNVDTNRIIGLEALVRWHYPTRGIVSPAEFIPIAEKSGLIVELGSWVLHEACRQMKEWLDAGVAPPLIAVNVSGLQFKAPAELEHEISEILAETALPPSLIELELTDTVFMEVSREHSDSLQRLRDAGLRLAIDDFGTGYSSLEYLGRIPVNRIKIAQAFMPNLTAKSQDGTIVKASIGMAHELGLDVIIERVETAEQIELIRSWNGHKCQGFYFSKPLSVSETAAVLRVGKRFPAQ